MTMMILTMLFVVRLLQSGIRLAMTLSLVVHMLYISLPSTHSYSVRHLGLVASHDRNLSVSASGVFDILPLYKLGYYYYYYYYYFNPRYLCSRGSLKIGNTKMQVGTTLPCLPYCRIPFHQQFLHSPLLPSLLLLEEGPLNPARGFRERSTLPSAVWDRAPAEVEFAAL